MSSPSTDDASTASLEPTQFNSFHVHKASALVSWIDDSNQYQSLSGDSSASRHVTFDIHHAPESNTALFKITANVAYRGKRNKSNVFVYIYPERIRHLSVVDNDDAASGKLGTSAYTLEFALSRLSALVVPKGDWAVSKNEAAESTLASLEALSRMAVFRVAFPSRALARDRLVALCDKASLPGCLETTPEVANITKLYGGKGGKIVEYGQTHEISQNTADQAQATDNPPSYGDLGASPPPHPSQAKKRRRLDSDDDAGAASEDKMTLDEICKKGFAEIGRRFDRIEKSLSVLTSRLDRVEQQLARENHSRGGTSAVEDPQPSSNLDARIDGVEERITGVEKKLEVGLIDLAQDVENQMYDVRHEFNNQISVRVDDEVGVAQSHLEDFVKDELYNAAYDVEEVIREKLRDALS